MSTVKLENLCPGKEIRVIEEEVLGVLAKKTELIMVKKDNLIPNETNPRYIKTEKFKLLLNSILADPWMLISNPIKTDEKGVILGGNMRYRAALKAGLKEIPTEVMLERTEKEKKDFIIKDNVGFGAWDWDILPNQYEAEELEAMGMDLPPEWDVIEEEAVEDDYVESELTETDIVEGDLFEIGEHRLLCGDSTSVDAMDKLMGEERADMVFTDPPWNVNYGADAKHPSWKPRTILNDSMSTEDFSDFMGDSFKMMAAFSKKGCPTYVVMSAQEWGNLMLALYENNYHWSSTIIWNKSSLVLSRKDYHTKYEPIWYGWLSGAPRLCPLKDRKQSDVWDVDRPSKSELHPTTKPIELINIALKNSSKKKDLVMELFTGSGSTMVAAHQLKRRCYGMELDPKYCQVIVDRMIKLDPSLEVKKNGEIYN